MHITDNDRILTNRRTTRSLHNNNDRRIAEVVVLRDVDKVSSSRIKTQAKANSVSKCLDKMQPNKML